MADTATSSPARVPISIHEAAPIAKLSVFTIANTDWRRSTGFPTHKVGPRALVFFEDEVLDWLKRRAT